MIVDDQVLKAAFNGEAGPTDTSPPSCVPHAVCLVLLNDPSTKLLLIQKADTDGYPWRDHVAMPGGRIERSDQGAQDAALRELREELGIEPSRVDVLGNLGHFQTRVSKNDLEVFVTRWTRRSALQVDEREVGRVLECPLSDLVALHVDAGFRGLVAAEAGDALVYRLADARVWGVTARILHRFLELVLDEGAVLGEGPRSM